MKDGRRYAPKIEARMRKDGAAIEVLAPCPGLWREAPEPGSVVMPAMQVGKLDVLGVLHDLIAPEGAQGVVAGPAPRIAQRPVEAGEVLLRLEEGAALSSKVASGTIDGIAAKGPVFRTPLGGRYYARPTPGAEPFVKAGDVLRGGETVALIEVMKTFNRVQIAGVSLPAKVARVVPNDGDDVEANSVLIELEG